MGMQMTSSQKQALLTVMLPSVQRHLAPAQQGHLAQTLRLPGDLAVGPAQGLRLLL